MIQHAMLCRARPTVTLVLTAVFFALFAAVPRAQSTLPIARLAGHLPPLVSRSRAVSRIDPAETIQLALVLPLRNQAKLDTLLHRLYDPNDSIYGHYLTPQQFTAAFGPTQADYDAVIAYARSKGLQVTGIHSNRLLVDVAGPARAVEQAFGTRLMRYQGPDGRLYRAPDSDPAVPVTLANRLAGIVGLDTAAVRHAHCIYRATSPFEMHTLESPHQSGSGPGGGMAPSDIKTAYNLSTVTANGSGQTLAAFELSGYTVSDITGYETHFGLPSVTLQNVLVDGASGQPGDGADEVTLDIELQIALASGTSQQPSKILVYEGPNTNPGVIDTYNKIASDDLAKEICSCWGSPENTISSSDLNSENSVFQQMAAQGQTIFAAGGDNGAYDDGRTLSVDDPASQPYVTGCGGTTLTTSGPGGAWQSETTWNGGSVQAGAGGGGISAIWSIPSYQSGIISAASLGSTTMRNVPDVSLNADPNTGYAIYYQGSWSIAGGTSCVAPLWSAIAALINQERAANGKAAIGFLNPSVYTIGKGSSYASNFHDIADDSTNLYYPAVTGYDEATGWGTLNGANLLQSLSGKSSGFLHLIWQNMQTGDITYWLLNGTQYTGQWGYIYQGVPLQWKIVGALDLNGDGNPDLLWQNTQTGDITYWLLNGTQYTGQWGYIYQGVPTQWQVVGVSDLDGDGSPDLLWQNMQTGDITYWLLNGTQYTGQWGYIYKGIPTQWQIVGALNLTSTGQTDVLWQNMQTGDITYWVLSGEQYTGQWGYIYQGVPLQWKIVGALDLNGDGNPDLLWQNTQTGDITYWLMNGTQYTGQWGYIYKGIPLQWKIVGSY